MRDLPSDGFQGRGASKRVASPGGLNSKEAKGSQMKTLVEGFMASAVPCRDRVGAAGGLLETGPWGRGAEEGCSLDLWGR